jgi:hypothetical protein
MAAMQRLPGQEAVSGREQFRTLRLASAMLV